MVPEVIYENGDFLAVLKPSGLMVHPAKVAIGRFRVASPRIPTPTLVDWLIKKYPQVRQVGDDPATRPGIVHRLDKETSGIMIIAKTQPYFEYLKSLFQKHLVRKTYYAWVRGVPKQREGTIDAPIGIVNGTLRRSIRSTKMRKEAVTKYRIVKTKLSPESTALLEITPLTGRTHQIRVHLASIGHPVIGDRLYGSKKQTASRLMLHAASIEFPDGRGGVIRLSTELPF